MLNNNSILILLLLNQPWCWIVPYGYITISVIEAFQISSNPLLFETTYPSSNIQQSSFGGIGTIQQQQQQQQYQYQYPATIINRQRYSHRNMSPHDEQQNDDVEDVVVNNESSNTNGCTNNNNDSNNVRSISDGNGNDRDNDNDDKKLFSIGLVADIQYAPVDDGFSYSGNARYYRNALKVAKIASQQFQSELVDCVINLGDLIDGKCATLTDVGDDSDTVVVVENNNNNDKYDKTTASSQLATHDVLKALSYYTNGPIYHTYGNHCLYNMDRTVLRTVLNIPFVEHTKTTISDPDNDDDDDGGTTTTSATTPTPPSTKELVGYYSTVLYPGYRMIVIDSYDICVVGRDPKTSSKYQEAYKILQRENTINVQNGTINSPDGLDGYQKRFVAFNGGISQEQFDWIETTLQQARHDNEYCILVSHQPIHPNSCNPTCLIWNYETLVILLSHYKDIIIASFSGHAHKGGYYYDTTTKTNEVTTSNGDSIINADSIMNGDKTSAASSNNDTSHGIHYRVVEAVLENIPPSYIIANVYKNRIVMNGYGNCESATYYYDTTKTVIKTTPPPLTTAATIDDSKSSTTHIDQDTTTATNDVQCPIVVQA